MKKMLALLMACSMMGGTALTVLADGSSSESTPDSGTVAGNINGITLKADANGLELGGARLTPGTTYRFPVYVTYDNGTEAAVNKDLLETYKINVSNDHAASFESTKVDSYKGEYSLVVKTKAGWPTKQSEVTIKTRLLDKKTSKEIASVSKDLIVGYAEMDDSYINGLGEGETITVDPANPVITEDQFKTIHEANEYKPATFSFGDWTFTARVGGQKTTNLVSNNDAIEEILAKYEDQEFKFVTFPAGPSFKSDAKVSIDVSAEASDFDENFYLYRYADGKLSAINSTYNREDGTLDFSTKQLGRFVITDKKIANTTVVEGGSSSSNGSSNSGSDSSSDEKNPDTGANDVVGVAVALAVISLAAAGAVTLKKNNK